MARQRDVACCGAPMFRVVKVGLVQRAALAPVDGPGIAVPKILKFGSVELDGALRAAVNLDGDLGAVYPLHGANLAVVESSRFVGARELNPVEGREVGAAVTGLERLILPFHFGPFLDDCAKGSVKAINVLVGIGEHETGFRRIAGTVEGPARNQSGASFGLRAGPVDRRLWGA